MLDFGFSEILLTSVIALVVLGPERLPRVARQVGNWMGRARVMARQLSEQLDREVAAADVSKEIAKAKSAVNSMTTIDPLATSAPASAHSSVPDQSSAPAATVAYEPVPSPPPADPVTHTATSVEMPKPGHE